MQKIPTYLLKTMKALIYKPVKNPMQSGKGNTKKWLLKFLPENTRTIDPIMGWSSNSDPKQQLTLKFNSMEDAVKYAESRNIEWSEA